MANFANSSKSVGNGTAAPGFSSLAAAREAARRDSDTRLRYEAAAASTVSTPTAYHLISGLQAGADRGALLGFDDARAAAASGRGAELATTGGFAPLGFKCDDYIQDSDVDPEAAASIAKEREWIRGPINPNVRGLIERFGVKELPNESHKVKFGEKDRANADACCALVAFRAPVPSSGAGTEQTVNYACFGEYSFVEQFRHGGTAGGALQRDGFVSLPGWPAAHLTQVVATASGNGGGGLGVLEFERGRGYSVLQSFEHRTSKDEARSAAKGIVCHMAQPLTQAEATAPERTWEQRVAQRSALVLTLGGLRGGVVEGRAEVASKGSKAEGEEVGRAAALLAGFLRRCASASGDGAVKVMVSGPTESVFPGTQERVRAIFAQAFAQLFAPTDA